MASFDCSSMVFDSEVTAESDDDCTDVESAEVKNFDKSLSSNVAKFVPMAETSNNNILQEVKKENTYILDESSIDIDAFHSEYIIKDETDYITLSSDCDSRDDGNSWLKQVKPEIQSEEDSFDPSEILPEGEHIYDETDSQMPVIVDVNKILNMVEPQTNISSLSSINHVNGCSNVPCCSTSNLLNEKPTNSLRNFRKHDGNSIDETIKGPPNGELPNRSKMKKRGHQRREDEIKFRFCLSEEQIKRISTLGHVYNTMYIIKFKFDSIEIAKSERLLGLFISRMNEHNNSNSLNQSSFSNCVDLNEEIALQKLVSHKKLIAKFILFENLLFQSSAIVLRSNKHSSNEKLLSIGATVNALIVLKELFITVNNSFKRNAGKNKFTPIAPKGLLPYLSNKEKNASSLQSKSLASPCLDIYDKEAEITKKRLAKQSKVINRVVEIIVNDEHNLYREKHGSSGIAAKLEKVGRGENVVVLQGTREIQRKYQSNQGVNSRSLQPRLVNRQRQQLQVRQISSGQRIENLASTSGQKKFEVIPAKQMQTVDINQLQQNHPTMSSMIQSLVPSISSQSQLQPFFFTAAASSSNAQSSTTANTPPVPVPLPAPAPQDITAHIFSNGILLEMKHVVTPNVEQ